jgi:hypothetical protein
MSETAFKPYQNVSRPVLGWRLWRGKLGEAPQGDAGRTGDFGNWRFCGFALPGRSAQAACIRQERLTL